MSLDQTQRQIEKLGAKLAEKAAAQTPAERDRERQFGGPAPENSPAPQERTRVTPAQHRVTDGANVDDLAAAFHDKRVADHQELVQTHTVAERESASRTFLREVGIEPKSEEDEIIADALLIAALRSKGFSNEEIDAADGRTLRAYFRAQSAEAHRRAPLDQAAHKFQKSGKIDDLGALFTEARKRR